MDNLTAEKLQILFAAIDRLLVERPHILVAIDGPCTAGKTTLAGILHNHYSCTVLHMDEFFLQSQQRTPERLAEPGGNVDYERFYRDVLLPLQTGLPFAYRPYCCQAQTLSEAVPVSITPLTVIEGTYSSHPYFQNPYDLVVFLTIDPDTQVERVGLREAWKQEMFFRQWIPMEQAYFEHYSIAEKCDLIL